MPVDTSIYSNLIRPPKSVLEYGQEMDAADAAKNQLATQKLNLIGQQRTLDEADAVKSLYARPDFNAGTPEGLRSLGAVSPTAMYTAQKNALSAQQTQATIDHLGAQTQSEKSKSAASDFKLMEDKLDHATSSIAASSDPNAARQAIQASVNQGFFTPEEGQQKQAAIPNDPAQFQQWRQNQWLSVLKGKDALAYQQKQAEIAETARHNTTSEADTRRGQDISASTSRQNTAANIQKDYRVAGLDANGNDTAGDTSLSPAAIENAAARYNVDGTMPTNIGRGAQGSRDLRKIQNRAAELALGVDPTQVRVNQLDAKSAAGALTQLTKAKTMAASFEDTANQNAELALSLSKKNDRTGIPLINAGLQAWRTGTGSPEATQFAAANETFVNEYAKIMSGGMGNGPVSDSARNKAHSLLETGMTSGQYEGNVRLLQKEMRNRMKGFEDQEAAVRKRIGGGGTATTSGAATDDIHAQADAILKGGK